MCRAIVPIGPALLDQSALPLADPPGEPTSFPGSGISSGRNDHALAPARRMVLQPSPRGVGQYLPSLIVVVPRVLAAAWFVLALGIVSQSVPWFERPGTNPRRFLFRSFAGLLGLVMSPGRGRNRWGLA